jgi:small subunit ribosomal protein S5
VKATVDGLKSLRTPLEVAELRGLSVAQVLGLEDKRIAAAAPNGGADLPADAKT